MNRLVFALALLTACGDSGPGGNQASGAGDRAEAGAAAKSRGPLTVLTGLYEGGDSQRPNPMCVIEGGNEARFGLVVWGSNLHSCSGAGTLTRDGATLRLAMAGDETCTIEAAISGKTVTLPASIPDGCAYYCGARASLAGASFTQQGNSREDAGKAKDLVGDQLCVAN